MFVRCNPFNFFKNPEDLLADGRSTKRLSLSAEEQECHDKIVRIFSAVGHPRIEHSILVPTISSPTPPSNVYAIIFRDCESWQKVEAMFQTLQKTSRIIKLKRWALRWLNTIFELRATQQAFHITLEELQQYTSYKPKVSSSKLIAALNLRIITVKQKVKISRDTMQKQVEKIKHTLEVDLASSLVKYESAQKILNFMSTYWPNLTVFCSWEEVGVDVYGVCVQIRRPKLTQPDLSSFFEKNTATKAIFLIEAGRKKERWEYAGITPGKIVLTNFSLIEKYHDTATSTTEKEELTRESFFDVSMEEEEEKKINPLKRSLTTSTANKLNQLVIAALTRVNRNVQSTIGESESGSSTTIF